MTAHPGVLDVSYVVPLRWEHARPLDEFTAYLRRLAGWVDEVIVVDGSPAGRFEEHHAAWTAVAVHVPPAPGYDFLNGKVNGVLTGVDLATNERLVLADDDVRYQRDELFTVVSALAGADLVRPQNYFSPLPWHARWDTARTLLNRCAGGDFPGTFGVRRSVLRRTGGYDGDVLFENLQLMRTVVAAGGTVADLPGCFIRRLPPTAQRFVSQRTRQAYDELARPARLLAGLTVVPALAAAVGGGRWRPVLWAVLMVVAVAECGRRRTGGARVFPATSSLLAPAWVLERGVFSWVAVALRLTGRGCPYAGVRFLRATAPVRLPSESLVGDG